MPPSSADDLSAPPAPTDGAAPGAAVRQKLDGRSIAWIAAGLLVVAGLGLAGAVVLWPPTPGSPWRPMLLHALEGALVGGLCDWFAVRKTYAAIESRSVEVAEAIGRWVADELLNHHVVRKKLQELLADPRSKAEFYAVVDQWIGSVPDLEREFDALWSRIEPQLVDFAIRWELSPDDVRSVSALIDDDRFLAAAGTCLGKALEDLAASPELDDLVKAASESRGPVARLVMGLFVDVESEVKELGGRIRASAVGLARTGPVGPRAAVAFQRLARTYVVGWNEMRVAQKKEAFGAVVQHLKRPIFRSVARLVVEERERLRALERLRDHPRAQQLVDLVDRLVDERFSAHIGRFVTSALKGQTPQELRAKMEAQTGRYLQLIRVNGTLLGFGVGGLLGFLFGH